MKKVLDTKAGNGKTMEGTEAFQQLKLEVAGPVDSIAYTNTAENTRNFAKMLNQIGFMAPMFLNMAGANIDQEQLKPIQEGLALLPDLAKIVGKFDFLEANVTVIQGGLNRTATRNDPSPWCVPSRRELLRQTPRTTSSLVVQFCTTI